MRFIVLDLSSVPSMDTTATHILDDFVTELGLTYKATLMLASPTVEVRLAALFLASLFLAEARLKRHMANILRPAPSPRHHALFLTTLRPRLQVIKVLKLTGLVEKLGISNIFPTVADAVAAAAAANAVPSPKDSKDLSGSSEEDAS